MSPVSSRCRNDWALPRILEPRVSILPEDHGHSTSLVDQSEPPRLKAVRAKHAASLIVLRIDRGASLAGEPHMLMGMRGARHRFMPNRLVFPGGRVHRGALGPPFPPPGAAPPERFLGKNPKAR